MAVHIPHVPATFIHIPKTAGSSMSRWLKHCCHIDNRLKHCRAHEARQHWPDLGTTFTLVRNPWHRMVSFFFFIGQRAQQRIEQRLIGGKTKKSCTATHDAQLCAYMDRGFANWIRDLYQGRPNPYDITHTHYGRRTQQWHWAQDVDLVIKVEELPDRFVELQQLIGCNHDLPVSNTSSHGTYQQYYDDATANMIAELFRDDITHLRYDYSQ